MPEPLAVASRKGKLALLASILGSGMAFLDSTAVNVALPTLGSELGAGFADFQWVVNGYLLTLGALVLTGGSLADLRGRRRVFLTGTAGFALASLLCALASSVLLLVGARILQGAAAALLVPASLSLVQTSFEEDDRGRAIGLWAGLSGLATVLGPVLGGWLVETVSWRAVFLINPPIAVLTGWAALAYPAEPAAARGRVDSLGSVTATAALGGLVFALIQGPEWGWTHRGVLAAGAVALVSGAAFFDVEKNQARPMLPLSLFRRRRFAGANATTLLVYFVLSGAFFLLTLQLQRVMGYSALQAGLALIPVSLFLLVLSPPAGRWADEHGPRLPMTLGPLVAAAGLLLLGRLASASAGPGAYRTAVLPGLVVFGVGLGVTVAPLTAAALGALEARQAGLASGVNNAVARVAQLLAIPLLPLAAGLAGIERVGGAAFAEGFGRAMGVGAAVLALGGGVAWLTIRGGERPDARGASDGPGPAREGPVGDGGRRRFPRRPP